MGSNKMELRHGSNPRWSNHKLSIVQEQKKFNLLGMDEYNNSTLILTIQVYHVTKNMLQWEITIEWWKKYAKSLVAQWHWL